MISSVILFYVLKNIITQRQDEKLLQDKEIIARYLKYDWPLTILDVDDFKSKYPIKDTLYYKDTMMYQIINGVENYELYRQLTSIETLQGKTYKIIRRDSKLQTYEFVFIISISAGIIIFLLMLTIYYVNMFFAKRAWLPFYENLNTLKNYSVENKKPIKLVESNIDEFEELNISITKLTEKLSSDYGNLKEFTENASHEMQTPLAIMQTKLELLMQSENLSNNDKQLISATFSASKRLSKLNKALLMLSKIENQQYGNIEELFVNDAILKHLELFEDFFESKKISVSKNLTLNTKVNANPLLFDMIISNLLSNAIKHNDINGDIHITTNPQFLTVSNSGKALNISSESLFERFKKDSTSSESFGLGLAIVKKICISYQWDISHSFSKGQHHFIINF